MHYRMCSDIPHRSLTTSVESGFKSRLFKLQNRIKQEGWNNWISNLENGSYVTLNVSRLSRAVSCQLNACTFDRTKPESAQQTCRGLHLQAQTPLRAIHRETRLKAAPYFPKIGLLVGRIMQWNPLQVICLCVCLLMVQTRTLRVEIPASERIFSVAIETLCLEILDAYQSLSVILHHILPVLISYFY
jgi:hypothetical protein